MLLWRCSAKLYRSSFSWCGDYSRFAYSWRAEFDDTANVISALPAYS